MAKQTAKTVEKSAIAPQIDVDALVQRNGDTMKAFMKANEAMIEGMLALGREVMTFGNARLTHDLKTSEALMRCHGADEAFRVQCDFARDAAQQYLDEATRLMTLTAQLTRDCWIPLQERAQDAIEEIEAGNGADAPRGAATSARASRKTAAHADGAPEGAKAGARAGA